MFLVARGCFAVAGVGAVARVGSAEWSAATGLTIITFMQMLFAHVWPVQAWAQWCAGVVPSGRQLQVG